jgi:hypothetical protein
MLFAVESFFSYLDEADRRTSSAASCRQRQNDSRREWGRDGTGPSPVRPEIVCVCVYMSVITRVQELLSTRRRQIANTRIFCCPYTGEWAPKLFFTDDLGFLSFH